MALEIPNLTDENVKKEAGVLTNIGHINNKIVCSPRFFWNIESVQFFVLSNFVFLIWIKIKKKCQIFFFITFFIEKKIAACRLLHFLQNENFFCLKEKSQNFSTSVFSSGLFVVHDAVRGGQNDVARTEESQLIMMKSMLIWKESRFTRIDAMGASSWSTSRWSWSTHQIWDWWHRTWNKRKKKLKFKLQLLWFNYWTVLFCANLDTIFR